MSRSTYCKRARKAALPEDDVQAELIRLLKLPIASHERLRIVRRVDKLRRLFAALGPEQARKLYARLINENDPLAKFFDCELVTWLREELRAKVKERAVARRPARESPVKGLDRATEDTATSDSGIVGLPPPKPERKTFEPEPWKPEPWKPFGPPRINLPIVEPTFIDVLPKDLIDRAKKILEALKRSGGDPGIIQKLESLIKEADVLLGVLAPVLGFLVFRTYIGSIGQLVSVGASHLAQVRAINRFYNQIRDLEEILQDITDLINDPAVTSELPVPVEPSELPVPVEPQEESPPDRDPFKEGKDFETQECEKVAARFTFYAKQVKVKAYKPAIGMPGQNPNKLVLSDPYAKVDCIGSFSRTKNLQLFEIKLSGPPDFKNKGLTANQAIVYPCLKKYGGEIVSSGKGRGNKGIGDFKKGTKLPKGTTVKIITPENPL